MTEISTKTVYFARPGKENTQRTFELGLERVKDLGIKTIVVATTTGETGAKAASFFKGFDVITVTHVHGFRAPDEQELTSENRAAIEKAGARVLTVQHAFGGVNRAVRKKFKTYQLDEIIAHTLRIFGEGMKVVAEMALMTADAGNTRTDTPTLFIAGTGRGADTAAIVLPSNAHTFFDLKILEVICRPSAAHPEFR